MQELEQLISESYNTCWLSYKEYLKDHDMAAYNQRSAELVEKYHHHTFVESNLLLFAPVVQKMHDRFMKENEHGK